MHPAAASIHLTGLGSMATRALLADLAAACGPRCGVDIELQATGGVDAARRVAAGESFDLVFLASDALDRLLGSGRLLAGSRVDLVRSPVAVAVPAGAPAPGIGSEDALRQAVLAAPRLAYSTGPSGVQLLQLFQRWGIAERLAPRLVQAPPGVPVGALLARGDADLGFQQLAELLPQPGVQVLGTLPDAVAIITVFSAALGLPATQADAARALLAAMNAPEADTIKQRHGMAPA